MNFQNSDLLVSLEAIFEEINQTHFDGFMDLPDLVWNSRLRACAGRFFPGSRRLLIQFRPKIEIATYLLEEANAKALITDTLAHEMIHLWLWVRRKPYGHTTEFLNKMKQMGVSRYNPVPRTRPYKYLYSCGNCGKDFPSRKKLGPLACASCCKKYSEGRYHPKFKLLLRKTPPMIEE